MAIMTLGRSSKRGAMRHGLNVRVNMAAWYRYRIGITNISGACSSWADQSGNMRPLVQASSTLQPLVRSDGALVFDGVNDYLQAAFTLVQPFSVYLAFNQITWTSGDAIFDGVTAATKVTQAGSSPGLAANAGSALSTDTTIGVNTNGVIAFVANSTSSVYQAAGGAASVTTTGDAGANNAGGITLGALQAPSNYGNIAVYEMIVYSVAHDATTRLQIMRYLGRIAQVGGIN